MSNPASVPVPSRLARLRFSLGPDGPLTAAPLALRAAVPALFAAILFTVMDGPISRLGADLSTARTTLAALAALGAAAGGAIVPRTRPFVPGWLTGVVAALSLGIWQGYVVVGIDGRFASAEKGAHVRDDLAAYGPLGSVLVTSLLVGVAVTLALFGARLVLAHRTTPEDVAQGDRHDALFRPEWTDETDETVARPPRATLELGLFLIAWTYLGYLAFLAFGLCSWPIWPGPLGSLLEATFIDPLMTVNTGGKMLLMAYLALVAVYNPALRYRACWMLCFGHALSVGLLVLFGWIIPAVTHQTPMFAGFYPGAVVIDSTWTTLAFVGCLRSRALRETLDQQIPDVASIPAYYAKWVFRVLCVVSALFAVAILALRFGAFPHFDRVEIYRGLDIQLGNAVTKYAVLAALAWQISANNKLREHFQPIAVIVYGATVFTTLLYLTTVSGFTTLFHVLGVQVTELDRILVRAHTPDPVDIGDIFVRMAALSAVTLATLLSLEALYYRSEYRISSIPPATARGVAAFHDALFDVDPEDNMHVLQRIEQYVAGVRGRMRALLTLPYYLLQTAVPAVHGLPPLSVMSRPHRRWFIRRYLFRTPKERRRAISPELANGVFLIADAAEALLALAHFTSRNGAHRVGYVPPDARDRLQTHVNPAPPPFTAPAALPTGPGHVLNYAPPQAPISTLVAPRVVTPLNDPSLPDEVDFVVVGSGAGAGVVAWRLASAPSRPTVLVVERGPRLSPLQDFSHDELEMIRKLYRDGGLQQTQRFDMIVLQGDCVGGTTVINNATLYSIPPDLAKEWEDDHGISAMELDTAFGEVARALDLATLAPAAVNTRVAEAFEAGIAGYNRANGGTLGAPGTVRAAHTHHLGEGLCNLGNKYLRKRSVLETFLPWAEGNGAVVVSETEVFRLERDGGRNRVSHVAVRTRSGDIRRVKVKKAAVVAGGVIASSRLLFNSGIHHNVGSRMSCNFALPAAFDFPRQILAFDGAQITMGSPLLQGGIMYETYFNPPGAFALTLPFHLRRLQGAMARYPYLMNIGALVGSEPRGQVSARVGPLNSRGFSWSLGDRDRRQIRTALATLAEIGMHAGANHAMLPLRPGVVLPLDPGSLRAFKDGLAGYELTMRDIMMTTAHPQGGNCMSANPNIQAVDTEFRVRGWQNLYVADGSLFPTSVTVNPQWTIQALAWMASSRILAHSG
jgi:choline dehydrogenase-like flavoprotein